MLRERGRPALRREPATGPAEPIAARTRGLRAALGLTLAVALGGTPLGCTPPEEGPYLDLTAFWSQHHHDNFAAASQQARGDAAHALYGAIRIEGRIFATQVEGTVPLDLYWHRERSDHFTTATEEGAADALANGYERVRTEGYVFAEERPATMPLKLFYSTERQDNYVTASPDGEKDARNAGYNFVRIEGWILPRAR